MFPDVLSIPQLDFGDVPIGSAVSLDWQTALDPGRSAGRLEAEWAGLTEEFHLQNGRQVMVTPGADQASIKITFTPRQVGRRAGEIVILDRTGSTDVIERIRLVGRGVHPPRLAYLETSAGRRDDDAKEGRHFFAIVGQAGFLNACTEALIREGQRENALPKLVAVPAGTDGGTVTSNYHPQAGEILLSPNETFTSDYSVVRCFQVQVINPNWLTRHHTTLDDDRRVDGRLVHALGAERLLLPGHQPAKCEDCLSGPTDPRVPAQGEVFEDGYGNLCVVVSPPPVTQRLMEKYPSASHALVVFALPATPDEDSSWSSMVARVSGTGRLVLLPWTVRMWPLRRQYSVGRIGHADLLPLLQLCSGILGL